MTPQQVLQTLSSQLAYRQLAAALDPLFRLARQEQVITGLRREAAKIRRELCRKIAKAMKKMKFVEQPSMTVVSSAELVAPRVGERLLHFSIVFVFFVSAGAVCMCEPVIKFRFA